MDNDTPSPVAQFHFQVAMVTWVSHRSRLSCWNIIKGLIRMESKANQDTGTVPRSHGNSRSELFELAAFVGSGRSSTSLPCNGNVHLELRRDFRRTEH